MENSLQHHGIKGQRWGVRRFQNEDGSLTKAGIRRYAKDTQEQEKKQLSDKQKIASTVAVGAIAVTAIVGGAYGSKKYVDVKSDKLTIAKGKAIYDHLAATTPWYDGASFNRAIANATSSSMEFVGQKRNFIQKTGVIKEYKNAVKSTMKGLDVSELDRRWIHYMNKH